MKRGRKLADRNHPGRIAAPLIRFIQLKRPRFPEIYEPGEYRARMRLFGIVPTGWQATMTAPLSTDPGKTAHTGRIDIAVGWLTPLIAAFARILCADRRKRWRALAANGFADLRQRQ